MANVLTSYNHGKQKTENWNGFAQLAFATLHLILSVARPIGS